MRSPFDNVPGAAQAQRRALHERGLAEGRGPVVRHGFGPTPYLDRELSNGDRQREEAREAAAQWARDCGEEG